MSQAIQTLPVLIVNVHSRCNCRCAMCDIWKTDTTQEIGIEQFREQLDSVAGMGLEWVVFSGGEPLMHSDLFALAAEARRRGIRVTLLTTGLLLERYAAQVASHIDDVIVSIDGPEERHDRIRGVPGAFGHITVGVRKLLAIHPAMKIAARCTVQKANHDVLAGTVEAVKAIGASSISFLAADLTSEAFNRLIPWNSDRQGRIALTRSEISVLQDQVRELIANGDGFVMESPQKLRRIVDHFRAHLGDVPGEAPRCNAPWVSAVIEADGSVRPCFFHPVVGNIHSANLANVLNGGDALRFRENLHIDTDSTCRNCVCSLHRATASMAANR